MKRKAYNRGLASRRKEEPGETIIDTRCNFSPAEKGRITAFQRTLDRRAALRIKIIKRKGGGKDER